MKTVRAILKTVLIFAVFMIALLAVSIYLILPKDKSIDPKKYASYVNKNLTKLTETAEDAMTSGSTSRTTWPGYLANGHIHYIWPAEDRVIFSLYDDYAPVEGQIHLVYFPDGEYVFPFDGPEWYSVDTDDENVLRWEGGYAGRGWVDVTRMSDCFYLEEAYLPT